MYERLNHLSESLKLNAEQLANSNNLQKASASQQQQELEKLASRLETRTRLRSSHLRENSHTVPAAQKQTQRSGLTAAALETHNACVRIERVAERASRPIRPISDPFMPIRRNDYLSHSTPRQDKGIRKLIQYPEPKRLPYSLDQIDLGTVSDASESFSDSISDSSNLFQWTSKRTKQPRTRRDRFLGRSEPPSPTLRFAIASGDHGRKRENNTSNNNPLGFFFRKKR